jgi:uncharacterized protein (TIGR01244 family)
MRALLVLALGVSPLLAGVPETAEPGAIPAYRLIRPDLATAGQPSPDVLARLAQMGFKTVINLRTEGEGAVAEKAVVEGQGLRYVWIPVTPDSFSLSDVQAIEEVLDDPGAGPFLFHCASSSRVGAAWAVIEARKGRSTEAALTAGRTAGLRSPQMEAAVWRVLGVAAPPALPSP